MTDIATDGDRRFARSPLRFVHPGHLELMQGLRQLPREQSWQDTMKWFLKTCKTEIVAQEGEFAQSGPQIILTSHKGPMTAFAIGASIARDDVHYMGLGTASRWGGEETMSRFFPIHLSQQASPYLRGKIKNGIYHRLREGIDGEEASRRNLQSLMGAAKCVDKGGTVLLAPTGGTGFRTNEWKVGAGALMKLVRNPDAQVAFVFLRGDSMKNMLRLLNPYIVGRFLGKLDITLHVHTTPLAELKAHAKTVNALSDAARLKYLEYFGEL